MLSTSASLFRELGDPGVLVLGVAAYGAGRVGHVEPLADIGWHVTEAIVASGAITGVAKYAFGRARPYAVKDSNSGDFAFGRGLRSGAAFQSLPSGHVTAAFAAAGVLASEAERRWPAHGTLVAASAYCGAAMVALSRIYTDSHWASDVALAAGVGILSARVLGRAHHDDHWTGLDRWIVPSELSAGPSGELHLGWRAW